MAGRSREIGWGTVNIGVYNFYKDFCCECACFCPEGYELLPGSAGCYQILTEAPTGTGSINTMGGVNGAYGAFGLRIYEPGGYTLNGTLAPSYSYAHDRFWPGIGPGNVNWTNSDTFWSNRLLLAGVWSGVPNPGTSVSFCAVIDAPETGIYYLGIGIDNYATVVINGVTILNQSAISFTDRHTFWNIYPVTLNGGPNSFQVVGTNLSGPATFAAELYNNTVAELEVADSLSDLTVLFSTADFSPLRTGQFIHCNGTWEGCGIPGYISTANVPAGPYASIGGCAGYTCPSGYILNLLAPGGPRCEKINTVDCSAEPV